MKIEVSYYLNGASGQVREVTYDSFGATVL